MTVAESSEPMRIDVLARTPTTSLLQEAAHAEQQALADRLRFELPLEQWEVFQRTFDQPVGAKPNLRKLLLEPGLLG